MRRPSSSELLAWTVAGAVIGVAAGLVLGQWLGVPTPARARRVLSGVAAGFERERLSAAETTRVARRALEADPDLSALRLEPLAVGPGAVELHGWVPDRRLRARAARRVAEAEGIETLVNCLLVRGEDDEVRPALDAAHQSA